MLPAAAACVAATRRIGIGIGVFNPYNRHPTLIAMEIGALDELAQGRARLGIGSGIAAATERMGLSADRPLAAVRDAITIVRAMLAGEEVTYTGTRVLGAQGQAGVQGAAAGHAAADGRRGEQALALCGEIADGLMISNMCPPHLPRQAVEVIATVRTRTPAGPSPPRSCSTFRARRGPIGRGPRDRQSDDPRRCCRRLLVAGPAGAVGEVGAAAGRGLSAVDFAATVDRLRAGEAPAEMLDERFVDAFAIAGTAEDALPRRARYREAGATELVLTFVGTQPEADMADLTHAMART